MFGGIHCHAGSNITLRPRASGCTRELVLLNGRSITVKEEEGVFLKNASF